MRRVVRMININFNSYHTYGTKVLSPGGELPPGLETERVSVKQSPVFIPSASADVADI